MLVVDLLHEFEIGVWKSLFTHLIRLLYAAGKGSDRLVTELDARFELVHIIVSFYSDAFSPLIDTVRYQRLALALFVNFPRTRQK